MRESTVSLPIKLVRYATAREVMEKFFGFPLEEIEEVSGADVDGNKGGSAYTPRDMLAGLEAQGIWGFAELETRSLHYWDNARAEFPLRINMYAHELAHLRTPQQNTDEDERRSCLIGDIAAEAAKLAKQSLLLVADEELKRLRKEDAEVSHG